MTEPASNYAPSGTDLFTNILHKVKTILFKPADAWRELSAEQETTADFYKNYLIYMAAIGPVCTVIGGALSPQLYMSFANMIVMAVVTYAIALAIPAIMGFVVTKIAPMCGGQISYENGVRLIGYSATATYVAGFLSIIPMLALLSILFLAYAIYTLYLGVPIMSTVAKDQSVKFSAITVVAWLVLSIVLSLVVIPIFVGSTIATSAITAQ